MEQRTQVKVCGLRRYEDAALALDEGAWALGFIFHKPSKRYIEPEEAARLVARLPRDACTIGVFVDYPLVELNRIVEQVALTGVQLHGAESPEYAVQVDAEVVLKALRVGDGFDVTSVDAFANQLLLLDTYHPQQAGGTGETFDWEVARRVGERAPYFLAGGLRPENVSRAIAEAQPHGVDVSGGLEASAGCKDPEKMRRFFAAVRGEG